MKLYRTHLNFYSVFYHGLFPLCFLSIFSLIQSFKMEATVAYSFCEKKFSDEIRAKDHERQVHKEENVSCAVCGKLETNIYTLMSHMQNHETKLCDICSEYQPKKNFSRHMDNHDQTNKYFECTTCDANFNRKDSLKRHMKTHEKAVKDNFTPPIVVAKKTQIFHCEKGRESTLKILRRGTIL